MQMSTKRPCTRWRSSANDPPTTYCSESADLDPTTILISGLPAGLTTIELTDMENKSEEFNLIVQLDVEYLRTHAGPSRADSQHHADSRF